MWKKLLNIAKEAKDIVTIVAALGTVGVFIFTIVLANKTSDLVKVDLESHLSPSDTLIETIDSTGTIVRQISWRNGELLPNQTVDSDKFTLAIKIKNTGRLPVVLDRTKLKIIKDGHENNIINSVEDNIILSGMDETGWISPQDITNYIMFKNLKVTDSISNYLEAEYSYRYHPLSDANKNDYLSFKVLCSWEPYELNKNLQVKNIVGSTAELSAQVKGLHCMIKSK